MSRSYDTDQDSLAGMPFSFSQIRCLEYSGHGTATYVWVFVDSNQEITYCYGDNDSWTATAITGAGSAIGYNDAAIENVALKYDPNNNRVHIAFSADDKIYHIRLNDPDNPVNAQFTTFASSGQKWERVDNSANDKGSVSITVDDSTGTMNGWNRAHVAWDEDNSGTWEIHYNYAEHGPTLDEFNQAMQVKLSNGAYPSIINIMNEGREPHVYWLSGNNVVGMRCVRMLHPSVAANWTGPENRVNQPDIVITPSVTGDGIDNFSVSYYWDMVPFVLVVGTDAALIGGGVFVRFFGLHTPPSWSPELEVHGYTGHASSCSLTNCVSSSFRIFICNTAQDIYFAHEEQEQSNYTFDANSDWDLLATTDADVATHITTEWRNLGHSADATYRRTHTLWKKSGTNDIWFTQARENWGPVSSLTAPALAAKLRTDAGHNVILDWAPSDSQSDTQDDFQIQLDDDYQFGSPDVDPGWAGAGTATSQYTVTGGTLAPDTLWYWRVKLKDDEKGDEYDPYSIGEWSDYWYFYSTPNVSINLLGYSVQSDKDIYLSMRFVCDLALGETLINAELDDGAATVYAQYTTDDGLNWSTMTVKVAECTGSSVTSVTTARPPGALYTLAWDAATDLGASFVGNVRFRVRAEYDADVLGLGYCSWEEYPDEFYLDYKAPVVIIVWPIGDNMGNPRPTVQATITDDNGWSSQFQITDDPTFVASPEYDSGYVASATTYTPTADLAIGTWYWRVRAKDDWYPLYNESAWADTGSFTIRGGTYTPSILDDGTDAVSLYVNSDMDITMANAIVEYENIANDFEETDVLQNTPEYRGHSPIEIQFTVVFVTGWENNDDIKQLHTWQRDETKLIFKSSDEKIVSLGNSIASYQPDKFKIIALSPAYTPGEVRPFNYSITLREVQP